MGWRGGVVTRAPVLACAALLAAAALETAAPAAAEAPEPPPYSYLYHGATIALVPSTRWVAAFARTAAERGTPPVPPDGTVIDPRSAREALRARGLTLLRALVLERPKGLAVPPPRDLVRDVLAAQLAPRPVFEQGRVLRIPTDEVLIGLDEDWSKERLRAALVDVSESLGIVDVDRVRDRTWALRLKDANGARAFAASRTLAGVKGVQYAEPNFVDLFDPPGLPPPALPPAPAKLEFVEGRLLEPPPGARALATWERPHVEPPWELALEQHFESLDMSLWLAARAPESVKVAPALSTRHAHGGKRSINMTGADLAGRADGPYPENVSDFLVSPDFVVRGPAFCELWFRAQFENPAPDTRMPYDFGRVLLVDAQTNDIRYVVPLAPVSPSGDLARDPGSDDGWQRLVFRIPPALRSYGLRLVVQFVSDGSGAAEGLYVDDVRILTRPYRANGFKPSNDPYSPEQYVLAAGGQVAARPLPADPAVHAAAAWSLGLFHLEERVALLDDGVERSQPELLFAEPDRDMEGSEEILPAGDPLYPEDRHGTACAGVLGAIANNELGIAGVAPGVPLLPLRRGADDVQLALGVDDAVRHRARVLVVPWGWPGAPSRTLERALLEAVDAGVTVIAAAGEAVPYGSRANEVDFPCVLGGRGPVVCVGAASPAGEPKDASSVDGQSWWRSKSGDRLPDLLAPGTNLLATDRVGVRGYNDGTNDVGSGYTDAFAGTGAAACVVAGVAALARAHDPELTPAELKRLLVGTSTEVAKSARSGGTRLVDAEAAVRAAIESARARREAATSQRSP